jgi:heme-degrading monooxygenase HmoA
MTDETVVYALALWKVKPGSEAAFIAAWQEFAVWTARSIAGAGAGHLVQDINEPARMISFGPWPSLDRIDEWRQRPEFKAFFGRARELCEAIEPHTLKEVAVVGSMD